MTLHDMTQALVALASAGHFPTTLAAESAGDVVEAEGKEAWWAEELSAAEDALGEAEASIDGMADTLNAWFALHGRVTKARLGLHETRGRLLFIRCELERRLAKARHREARTRLAGEVAL